MHQSLNNLYLLRNNYFSTRWWCVYLRNPTPTLPVFCLWHARLMNTHTRTHTQPGVRDNAHPPRPHILEIPNGSLTPQKLFTLLGKYTPDCFSNDWTITLQLYSHGLSLITEFANEYTRFLLYLPVSDHYSRSWSLHVNPYLAIFTAC